MLLRHFSVAPTAVLFITLVCAVAAHGEPSDHADELQRYVVDNSKLSSKLGWLSYRSSPDLNDFAPKTGPFKPGEVWGSEVAGVSEGEWVRVGNRYLPKTIRGFPVLTLKAAVAVEATVAENDKVEQQRQPLATLATTAEERPSATTDTVESGDVSGGGDVGLHDVRPHDDSAGVENEVPSVASGAGGGVTEAADSAPAVLAGGRVNSDTDEHRRQISDSAGVEAKPAVTIADADAGSTAEPAAPEPAAVPQAPAMSSRRGPDVISVTSRQSFGAQDSPSKQPVESKENLDTEMARQHESRTDKFMKPSPQRASDAVDQDAILPVALPTSAGEHKHPQAVMHAEAPPPPPIPSADNSVKELMAVPDTEVFGDSPNRGVHDAGGVLSLLSTLTLWVSLSVLVSVFYYYEKAHPPRLDPEGVKVQLHERERLDKHRWRFGLFECGGDTAVCASSFFCAPVRWADTMRMAGLLQFFVAIALVWCLVLTGFVAFYLGFVVLLGCLVHYRQRIRQMFDIPNGSFQTIAEDVATYLCCCFCAVAQEARQLEEAYLARHPAVHHRSSFRVRFEK